MNGETIWLLFGATQVMCVVMLLLWVVYLVIGREEIVDLGWTIGIGVLCSGYFLVTLPFALRPLIVFLLTILWSSRLAYVLIDRLVRGHRDRRYLLLRELWGEEARWKFLLLFLAQGVIAVFFTLPMAQVMSASSYSLAFSDGVALVCFLGGWWGVYRSDETLRLFKLKEGNSDKVCQEGLWYYSRHPNYFFEIITWLGFALFAYALPWGFLSLSVPIALYYLICYVTGIPMTEKVLLLRYGERYKEYQKTTSPLFPTFPLR